MSREEKDGFQKAGAKIHFFLNAKKNKKDFLVTKVMSEQPNSSFYAYLYSELNVFVNFAGLHG